MHRKDAVLASRRTMRPRLPIVRLHRRHYPVPLPQRGTRKDLLRARQFQPGSGAVRGHPHSNNRQKSEAWRETHRLRGKPREFLLLAQINTANAAS